MLLYFLLKYLQKNIQSGLLDASMIFGRLEVIKLNTDKILINDTYNSNASSMIAAIKVLEKMPRYKILLVGDMSELGEKSIIYRNIIRNPANLSTIHKIFSFGKISHEITKNVTPGKHFLNKDKLK